MFSSVFWFKAFELIASLSILVFVHELGHFMWARIFKVGVEKFYLFFDTTNFALLRWNKKGLHLLDLIHFPKLVNPSDTEYGIGWIPLGGYCAIVGMIDETHDSGSADFERTDAFIKKSRFARFMIMVGGVLNNLILAVIIYIGLSWHYGKDIIEPKNLPYGVNYSELAKAVGFEDGDLIVAVDGKEIRDYNALGSALLLGNDVTVERGGARLTIALPDTLGTHFLAHKEALAQFVDVRMPMVLGEIGEGTPAALAGMAVGDSIVAIDSVPTPYAHQVRSQLALHCGDTVAVSYWRNGQLQVASVGLGADGKLGIYQKNLIGMECFTHIEYTLAEAIPAGFRQGWDMLYNYVRQFKLVFTKEGARELGGFGTMGSIFPEEWHWRTFWSLTAFFSVALAFMNILPIPALDGGHIMILIIEAIIRRPLSDKVKDILQYIGFGFVLLLLILVNLNDIIKFLF